LSFGFRGGSFRVIPLVTSTVSAHFILFKFAGSFRCGDAVALPLKHYVSIKLSDRAEYIQK
jgi:hypothetical protein